MYLAKLSCLESTGCSPLRPSDVFPRCHSRNNREYYGREFRHHRPGHELKPDGDGDQYRHNHDKSFERPDMGKWVQHQRADLAPDSVGEGEFDLRDRLRSTNRNRSSGGFIVISDAGAPIRGTVSGTGWKAVTGVVPSTYLG